MPNDAGDDDRTIALTKETKAALAAQARSLIGQPPAASPAATPLPFPAAPAPAVPAPVAAPPAAVDGDRTEPIDEARKADLRSQAADLLTPQREGPAAKPQALTQEDEARVTPTSVPDGEASRPRTRTKVAFTSESVAPVGTDLLPFEAPEAEGFDAMAPTHAGEVPAKPPPATPTAAAMPPPSASAPGSPTHFDVDVATRLKNEARHATAMMGTPLPAGVLVPPTAPAPPSAAPALGGAAAPASAWPSPSPVAPAGPSLAPPVEPPPAAAHNDAIAPPPPTSAVDEAALRKTTVLDMHAELSDGLGMLKVLGLLLVVVAAAALTAVLLK